MLQSRQHSMYQQTRMTFHQITEITTFFVDNEKKRLKIELDLENQIICEESCRLNDLTVILMLV